MAHYQSPAEAAAFEGLYAYHGQQPSWIVPRGGDDFDLRLVVASAQPIDKVFVRMEPDNEETMVEMKFKKKLDSRRHLYEASVLRHQHQDSTTYAFKILSGGYQHWLHAGGLSPRLPSRNLHFKIYHNEKPPEWMMDQVFYQIFPDRFNNGDPSCDVKEDSFQYLGGKIFVRKWGERPTNTDEARCQEFYNGDLEGIYQKLDYLQSLGVTAIYLNPIFVSRSNHKYDTIDYFNVDPHLGGNEALAKLSTELHRRGMKLILDAVLNHISVHHKWFDKYNEYPGNKGAYANSDSPYRKYFSFTGESSSYFSWKGYESLPKLDLSNEEVRKMLYVGKDCMLRHWMRPPYNADGWRLDAIHMIGEGRTAFNNAEHVRQIRKSIRAERADALCMGEHFHEASQWLQGDQEDSSMAYYSFLRPLWAFLGRIDFDHHAINIDASQFADWLTEGRIAVPWTIQMAQLNLIDSHDTRRMLTVLGGDLALMKIAVVMLFTYLGVPSVYYGDEIGLEGEFDPDCRRCFTWDPETWNKPLMEWYKALIKIRHEHVALRRGEYLLLCAVGDVMAFARFEELGGKDVVVTIINRGGSRHNMTLPVWQAGIDDQCKVESLLPEAPPSSVAVKGMLTVEVEPRKAYVLCLRQTPPAITSAAG